MAANKKDSARRRAIKRYGKRVVEAAEYISKVMIPDPNLWPPITLNDLAEIIFTEVIHAEPQNRLQKSKKAVTSGK